MTQEHHSADVRDILQISTPAAVPAPKKDPKKRKKGAKRADGMTRELYSLIGDNAPAVTMALPKMKERPRFKAKAVPWEHVPFVNQARKDGLQLKHWQPKQAEGAHPAEYKFAAFNTTSNVFSYTPEEYTKWLTDEDWSMEETDYLFDLCRRYDLRFVVIADRYEWPSKSRTLEDLKDRYYWCGRQLIKERPASDETAKQATANAYQFDKERELSRKQYLRSLMHRTPAQIAEEEFLYVESRRLEQTYAKTVREREDLLRLLGGPGSGASIPPALNSGLQSLPTGALPVGTVGAVMGAGGAALAQQQAGRYASAAANRRRSGRGATLDDEYNESLLLGGSGFASSAGKQKPPPKPSIIVPEDATFQATHFISKLDPANSTPYGLPKSYNHVAGGPSVVLRSTRLPATKQALQPRIFGALQEMGINQRLVMPTLKNQDRLEALVSAVGTLVDLKRQLDRSEFELDVARNRKVNVTPEGMALAAAEAAVSASSQGQVRESTAETDVNRKRSVSVSSSHGSAAGRPPKKRKR